MKQNSKIVIDPIERIIKNIKDTNSSVFLAGLPGTGKSVVLHELLNRHTDNNIIIDGTVKSEEYLQLKSSEIYNLYYTALIIKKVLLCVQRSNEKLFNSKFTGFYSFINYIIDSITLMKKTGYYKEQIPFVDEYLHRSPEILIDQLLHIMIRHLNFESIKIILDDFDKNTSASYQNLVYDKLKNHINFIMTVSDESIMNDTNKLKELETNSKLLSVDYSSEVDIVKEILNVKSCELLAKKNVNDLKYCACTIFSDEVILQMINKTNGNLFDMLTALQMFYINIESIENSKYEKFILDYIDQEINKNPIISGIIVPKRTLYINKKTTI